MIRMRLLTIGLFIAMVCAIALSGHSQSAPSSSPPASVAPPATAPVQQQQPSLLGPPPVQFEPAEMDFGMVKPSASVTGTVMIHNVSDKWLKIRATRASCTCTALDFASTEIAPGQAVPLEVGYHASTTMGPKNNKVFIMFHGYDDVEVPLRAYVGLPVRAEPMFIDALKKKDGTQALTGQFSVYSIDQKPFRILAVNGQPPAFVGFNPTADEPRHDYLLAYDLTGYDATTCRNAAGERFPGSIIVETDHAEAPIFDLEVRHECNARQMPTPMATWILSDKRVLIGKVKPGEPIEVDVLAKWLPKRTREDQPQVAVSESDLFQVSLVDVKGEEDSMFVRLRITPTAKADGLIVGAVRLHGNRQSAAVTIIGTARE